MSSRLVISNRAAAASSAGYIHTIPKGELPNREANVMQVLDDQSHDSILGNIRTDQQRLGDRWPGVYAGREHFIYEPDQDSAALGWFKEFEKRADGIWANADGLTPSGRAAVANGEYKFTSFVADRKNTQNLGKGPDGMDRVRILKIDTIGFTNMANGRELLTPIFNRQSAAAPLLNTPESRHAIYPLPPRIQFQEAVRRDMKLHNRGFAESWQWASVRLHGLTHHPVAGVILRNRQDYFGAADAEAGDTLALWSDTYLEANGREAALKDYVQQEIESLNNKPFRGRVLSNNPDSRLPVLAAVMSCVRSKMSREGMTFKQAWDWTKENDPINFSCAAVECDFESC